jgi:hypothetical protein
MGKAEYEPKELIYYLYKDLDIISSLYAQLFEGDSTLINKNMQLERETQGSLNGGASIGLKIPLTPIGPSGNVNGSLGKKRRYLKGSTETINPHDYKIELLLRELNIRPQKGPLSNNACGQLTLLNGNISIADGRITQKIASTLLEAVATSEPEMAQLAPLMRPVADKVFASLSLQLKTKYDANPVVGTLKETWLAIGAADIFSTYGADLVGTWDILCIVDRINESESEQTGLMNSLEFTKQMAQFRETKDFTHVMVPILVWRKLIYIANKGE